MKKIFIAIGIYFGIYFQNQAQTLPDLNQNTNSNYALKKLKLEEINFVGSYYIQDGENSAVTGGKGTEFLYNIGNSIDVNLSLIDKKERKHTFNAEVNIDAYTSASSDNIDPVTVSGASRSDLHVYPSINYAVNNPNNGISKKLGLSYSTEWDYHSIGLSSGISLTSLDKNTEIAFKAGAFWDKWTVILPYELRPTANSNNFEDEDDDDEVLKSRNTYYTGITISHVFNKDFQALLMIEPSYQEGLLSTPYHRVYFTNGNHTVERLPGDRFKLPVGIRASYFIGDNIILRSFYRYYIDSWGMVGHTASLEIPIKINPFVSFSPFYRYNRQTAVQYFGAYGTHDQSADFYTSDHDIAGFDSHYAGMGFRRSTPGGVFGINHLNALEARLAYYQRSNGLKAGLVSILFKIK